MTLTIWGVGAMGGTVGARAGHDVLLVDADQEHVDAIRAGGLRIVRMRGKHRFDVDIVTPGEVSGSLGTVILAVKCHHTATALSQIGPLLAADGHMLSLQNGLNEEVIARELGPARTVGCFVNFSADITEPDRIEFGGEHPLSVGELDGQIGPRLQGIATTLSAFGETVMTPTYGGTCGPSFASSRCCSPPRSLTRGSTRLSGVRTVRRSSTSSSRRPRRCAAGPGRHRTIQIQAGQHIITAADPLPDDLRQAIEAINGPASAH